MRKIILMVLPLFVAYASLARDLNRTIRQFIENQSTESPCQVEKEDLYSNELLHQFYMNRLYRPAWVNENNLIWFNTNMLDKNGYILLDYIRHIDEHGLNPSDYHLSLIEKYVEKITPYGLMPAEDLMKLDILLTDAYLLLGQQMYYGKVDSEKEGDNWQMQRKEPELRLDQNLEEALASNDPAKELNMLAPQYRAYWMMKENLAFFLGIANEAWPPIVSSTIIKPGDTNQILPKIRERLIKLRYQLLDSISTKYDQEFEKQMKMFQNDWGLNTDGVIGNGTLLALNYKPEKLISQLKVNMERFRWLPLHEPKKYIIVNIANFNLVMIDGADTLISMRAIVGKDYRETPVFNAQMTYLVFAPSWTVPPTILKNDVIPELLKGPEYLAEKNMKLLKNNGTEIAYRDIDWSKISKEHFPFMVRQSPGLGNALGKIKFMFSNDHDVYIHDTPTKGYFARDNRAISSGCIRIEKPYDLAVLLLLNVPGWSPVQIQDAMKQNKEHTISLKTPIEVVILYLTAWTNGGGRIQFRNDVYAQDNLVLKALNQKSEAVKIKVTPF
jgi:L,D-transpeptidase YcbB